MAIRRTAGEQIFAVFNSTLMVVLMIGSFYPFLYVALSSVSQPFELARHTGILWKPYGFQLETYRLVFRDPSILTGFGNTLFYVVVGTSMNIILTSLAAYVLSRKQVLWKRFFMILIVITMFFDGGIVPRFLIVRGLGLIDTRWALIFPTAMSAFNMIIMRTFFQGIPDSLEESARIDGASHWIILVRIVMPLSIPVVAVMILFYGVGRWNEFFQALLYLRDRSLFPIQLVLREILIDDSIDTMTDGMLMGNDERRALGETLKMAVAMVGTLPILMIYPLLQKHFVKGVMIGALKG